MGDIPDQLKAALADRYDLERVIGAGGMATVFLARDLKHRRQVAVKVLKAAFSATIGSDRFLREIDIAANLTHPHILPLHDSGEAEGLLYYVMPYIAGESLRGLLDREGSLSVTAALRITEEVADALSYAHREGVIHRDIKPENVLFSEGHAVVADFGIAKAISMAGREDLTTAGHMVGTFGYMSPEQAAGIADLDERTDVYSLACVFYEMVVGEIPEFWVDSEAARLRRFIKVASGHRERLDMLPGRLEQVLVRALAVDVDDRPAMPIELAHALSEASDRGAGLSDSRVEEIIGRAAELEARQPENEGALSIGGVEQVAAEVGIPPELVRQAKQELDLRSDDADPQRYLSRVGFHRRSPRLVIDRVADGSLSKSDLPRLSGEIHSVFGAAGAVTTVGTSLVWSVQVPGVVGRHVQLQITPQGEHTHIHVEEALALAGGTLFAPFFGAGAGSVLGTLLAVGIGVSPSPVLLIPAAASAFVGFHVTAYLIRTAVRKRRMPQLRDLVDRLVALVGPKTHRGGLGNGRGGG